MKAVAWQYRNIAEGTPSEWEELAPRGRWQTLEQRIKEIEGYRYNDKPCYEVRALGVIATPAKAAAQPLTIIDEWLHVPTLKLRAGEMTDQETRTVIAVLTAIRAGIKDSGEQTP